MVKEEALGLESGHLLSIPGSATYYLIGLGPVSEVYSMSISSLEEWAQSWIYNGLSASFHLAVIYPGSTIH